MKINTRYEVEEALAKLYFYTYISTIYELHNGYKELFIELLKIVERWIRYYNADLNLDRVTEEEINNGRSLIDSAPFDAYEGDYYEEVENWFDIVIYYASCPIGIEFDETEIKWKGGDRSVR